MSPKSIGKNNKSRKKLGEFHKRLILLLETDVPEWARKLHVSQSVIRDRWFKGSFPGSDKSLLRCRIKGFGRFFVLHFRRWRIVSIKKRIAHSLLQHCDT